MPLWTSKFTVEWWQQGVCANGSGAVADGAVSTAGVDGSSCLTVTVNLSDGPRTFGMLGPNPPAGLPGNPRRYGREAHDHPLLQAVDWPGILMVNHSRFGSEYFHQTGHGGSATLRQSHDFERRRPLQVGQQTGHALGE